MTRGWFEQDALWKALGATLAGTSREQRAEREVEALVGFLSVGPGDPVVDLASGPGAIAIGLARRGIRVTAVDTFAPFLTALGRDAGERELSVEVVRRDVRSFERNQTFAGAVLWGDTVGCFDSAADDRAVLTGAWRSLRDGGTLVVQITPKELAAATWPVRTWSEIGDRLVLEEHEILRDHSQVRHTWTVVEPTGARSVITGVRRLYSATELIKLLESAGFESVECLGHLDRRGFGRRAETLIAVARR